MDNTGFHLHVGMLGSLANVLSWVFDYCLLVAILPDLPDHDVKYQLFLSPVNFLKYKLRVSPAGMTFKSGSNWHGCDFYSGPSFKTVL